VETPNAWTTPSPRAEVPRSAASVPRSEPGAAGRPVQPYGTPSPNATSRNAPSPWSQGRQPQTASPGYRWEPRYEAPAQPGSPSTTVQPWSATPDVNQRSPAYSPAPAPRYQATPSPAPAPRQEFRSAPAPTRSFTPSPAPSPAPSRAASPPSQSSRGSSNQKDR
jgi:hypothetical protein